MMLRHTREIVVVNVEYLNAKFKRSHIESLGGILGGEELELSFVLNIERISEWLRAPKKPAFVLFYVGKQTELRHVQQLMKNFQGTTTKVGILTSLSDSEWQKAVSGNCEGNTLPKPAFRLLSKCTSEALHQAVRRQIATLD